ncbi:hypothetical protein BS47DRAFT_1367200 [Hydnum rufescens UP504]|uniref:Uncharacterized protein n=1 Tax=Hydnum rufescens UP504 TaxID=1448309 RepID=A0A9P6AJ00_9AGAM|nr:hypothetical protein BS47DRAFT_1367200 [Hydnum rufescens UP504]
MSRWADCLHPHENPPDEKTNDAPTKFRCTAAEHCPSTQHPNPRNLCDERSSMIPHTCCGGSSPPIRANTRMNAHMKTRTNSHTKTQANGHSKTHENTDTKTHRYLNLQECPYEQRIDVQHPNPCNLREVKHHTTPAAAGVVISAGVVIFQILIEPTTRTNPQANPG